MKTGESKYSIGDYVNGGVIVGRVEVLSRSDRGKFMIKCSECGNISKRYPTANQCRPCYKERMVRYPIGSILEDGREVVDRKHTKQGTKILIACPECNQTVWKYTQNLMTECGECRVIRLSYPAKERALCQSLSKYKSSAKKRGKEWLLTDEQARKLFLMSCEYCGAEPKPCNGIDRVDNTLGYISNNVVACCSFCNMAKRDHTLDEWNEWIGRLMQKYLIK